MSYLYETGLTDVPSAYRASEIGSERKNMQSSRKNFIVHIYLNNFFR